MPTPTVCISRRCCARCSSSISGHWLQRETSASRCRRCFASTQASRCSTPSTKPRRMGSRSEEHTSELQSLMRSSYAVFCLKKKKQKTRDYNKTKYIDKNHNRVTLV